MKKKRRKQEFIHIQRGVKKKEETGQKKKKIRAEIDRASLVFIHKFFGSLERGICATVCIQGIKKDWEKTGETVVWVARCQLPRPTLSLVASRCIQNDTQLRTTIKTQGTYTCGIKRIRSTLLRKNPFKSKNEKNENVDKDPFTKTKDLVNR